MRVLTFDTSMNKTYVSLFDGEIILSSKIVESTDDKYHSAFLNSMIIAVLKDNSLTMKDIEAIGVNVGPGSFTGIRVCMTVAKVIAQQLEIPLVGVSSLEILSKLNSSSKPAMVLLDARKAKCYRAIFKAGTSCFNEAEILVDIDDEINFDSENYFIITDEFMRKHLEARGVESTLYTASSADFGVFLGQLVQEKLANVKEEDFHWAKAKPMYIQTPSITLPATTSSHP